MNQDTELLDLRQEVANWDKEREKSRHLAWQVNAQMLEVTTNTDAHAEILALLCHERDKVYGFGGQLCLEWMLNHYIAMEFEAAYSFLIDIWKALINGNHHERNKAEYFNDGEAFYCSKEGMVIVFGKRHPDVARYLVIDKFTNLGAGEDPWHDCYVRKVWRKTGYDSIKLKEQPTLKFYRDRAFNMGYMSDHIIYGDARDPGHVLTYENKFGRAKCDKVIWNIREPLSFFFEVEALWDQLVPSTTAS